MEIAEALAYLTEHHRAVLATRRADGTPQLSPVTVAVDGEGHVVVSSREPAIKVRNLRRDPSVWLCVFPDAFFGPWIQIGGRAEVVPLPEAMDGLVAYYRAAAGEHPDWDEYRAAMEQERRVLIRITPLTAGPDVSG